jgi:glycosyltransferase involved in cell wall biosynthesis
LHILPDSAEFLPYSHISLSEWLPLFNQNENRPLRIGHAPSHRAVKGTELIIDAVEELKLAGYHFDFILIEGISSSEAKEIYKNIDVLVDQLFAGWYGGLAVEAMALGKPVIAYIRQEDLHFIPAQMRMDLPIFQAEPRTIHEVLENILKMPRTDLVKMAKKSRAYVEKWHNPITIAKRIKTDMEFALGKKK